MHIQFQLAQQCIQISTRINSSSVHTYIFVCFTLRVILQGFVTQNATQSWVPYDHLTEVADEITGRHIGIIFLCLYSYISSNLQINMRVEL